MAFTPVRPNDPLDQPSHSGLHNQHSQDIDDINEAQTLQDEKITDLEALNATLAGGNAGEVLGKSTNDDYDWEWIPAPTGGGGGDTYPGISTEQPNGLGIGTDGGLQVDPATLLSDADGQYLTLDDEGKIYSETLPPVPGKNLLNNGAMQVHQRGTSWSGTTDNGYHTADRWSNVFNGGSWSLTVEEDGPTSAGFSKSLKATCDTAAASLAADDQGRIRQVLEGQDLQRVAKGSSEAKPLTLSFHVKSNVTGTYVLELYDFDNARHVCQTYQVATADAWEKVSVTFPADQLGAFHNNNEASLYLSFWLYAGSDYTSGSLPLTWAGNVNTNRAVGQTNLAAAVGNYWQITGVQLEVGETATSFEHKKYGTELLECKRYYQQIGEGMTGHTQNNTTMIEVLEKFEVQMRTAPTVNAIPGVQASIRQAVAGATDQKAPTPILLAPSATKDSLWTIVDGFTGLSANWVSVTSRAAVGTAFMEASAEL